MALPLGRAVVYSHQIFFGGFPMSKKFFVVTLLVVILLLSACSTRKANDNDADVAQSTEKYEFLDVRLAEADSSHVMYGVFIDIHTLIGNNEVVVTAIQPVNKGGVDYDDYGFRTAFAPSELLEDIGMETYISDVDGTRSWGTLSATEPRYWKLTMASSADGGGFVRLPEFILSVEEVNVDDIPVWGGE